MTSRHTDGEPHVPGPDLTELRRALLSHYDRERRSLPWRGETDPYRVLVSEVMLQQTRVETVLRYYGAWLERFPDLEALAEAQEDAVLKAWEGLGYYRRARNLHRAARIVRERPDGALPSTYTELRRLPGLGDYTAGAVASIAFGEPVPAADGNVRRVLSRLFDQPDPPPRWLRDAAAALVDPARPGDWNQALMELGATVCAPRAPKCGRCPVARWCRARAAGTAVERPGAAARTRARAATFVLAVLIAGGRTLLERRPRDGLLGGLWAFPEREIPDGPGVRGVGTPPGRSRGASGGGNGSGTRVEEAALELAVRLGARPRSSARRLQAYDHQFTHLHATYLPCMIEVEGETVAGEGVAWIALGEPTELALPVTQRRILCDVARQGVAVEETREILSDG